MTEHYDNPDIGMCDDCGTEGGTRHPTVLTYSADGLALSVSFDRWDAAQHDRARWRWAIFTDDGGPRVTLAEGDDLTTVGPPDHPRALETLAVFLSAWVEGLGYPESDLAGLFPSEMLRIVDAGTLGALAESASLDLLAEGVEA